MNRRRTFLIIFVVLVLILVIGLAGLLLLTRGGSLTGRVTTQPKPTGAVLEPEATRAIETERVVVALQTIPRGMRIPPDAVEIREWPIEDRDFPAEPMYDLDKVVGMVARVEIAMHRPIDASMVKQVFLGEGSEMSLAVPKGQVAIAVPVMAISSVGNAIRPNDRVDVLISFSIVEVDEDAQIKLPVILTGGEDCLAGCMKTGDQIPRLVTQYSVQNALVMGVGMWTGAQPDITVMQTPTPATLPGAQPTAPVATGAEAPVAVATSIVRSMTELTVITLAVSPQDALVLKWAWESNSSIDLVMRSANDTDIYAQPEAVTLQYMIDRFQISLPPKLPNTPENKFEYRLIKEAEQRAVPTSTGQ
jgi:Flp pilus assembly protein CpaB